MKNISPETLIVKNNTNKRRGVASSKSVEGAA